MTDLKDFKIPNRTAPRFSEPNFNPVDHSFFVELRKEYPKFKNWKDTEIRKVIKVTNENICKEILNNREGVALSESLGHLFVGSCKVVKKDNINYAESIRYGKKIMHTNLHTNGLVGKVFYTNYSTKYKFKFHELWAFVACRKFKNKVVDTYKEKWNRFIIIEDNIQISHLAKQAKNRILIEPKMKEDLEKYDEFEGFR